LAFSFVLFYFFFCFVVFFLVCVFCVFLFSFVVFDENWMQERHFVVMEAWLSFLVVTFPL